MRLYEERATMMGIDLDYARTFGRRNFVPYSGVQYYGNMPFNVLEGFEEWNQVWNVRDAGELIGARKL